MNKITYPAMLVIAGLAVWRGTVWTCLLGGLVGASLMLFFVILSRGGMFGLGDVKLAAVIGMMTGFPLVLYAIGLSWVFGLVLALIFRGKKELPFAPAMSLAAVSTLVWQLAR